MWLEAILTKEDLEQVLRKLTPCVIRLGEEGRLVLDEPSEVSLVPDQGLRCVCGATLHWPVLGIDVPVTLRSLIVVICPTIQSRDDSQALAFKLQIEHIDVALLPASIDDRVTARVNEELAKRHVELAWNFAEALSHVFELPDALETTGALVLSVKSGVVRVTAGALGFAVSFDVDMRARVQADGAAQVPAPSSKSSKSADPVRWSPGPGLPAPLALSKMAFLGATAASTAVVTFFLGRLSRRGHRRWGR